MTATTLPTTDDITTTVRRPLLRAGARAGVIAAVATTAVVVAARAIDIPVDADGESFPILAFAQLTLFFTGIGVLIAWAINRRSAHARRTFVRTTVALTALSFGPDLMLSTGLATKLTLMTTHLVAAAIVIPALAGRLSD